ncbi:MAG: hypothetical protein V4773_17400 [Verrucomicrobiota bacterium]
MLEGCMDEYIYLVFGGLGGQGERTVVLSYPSGKNYAHKSEVLWQE